MASTELEAGKLGVTGAMGFKVSVFVAWDCLIYGKLY